MNMHYRRAFAVIAVTVALDGVLGIGYAASMGISVWRGLYYATGVATTSGNSTDLPQGWLPHALTFLMMVTVIPLVATAFSLVTTALTADHVDARVSRQTAEIKDHLSR